MPNWTGFNDFLVLNLPHITFGCCSGLPFPVAICWQLWTPLLSGTQFSFVSFCLSGRHVGLLHQLVFWCSCHLFLPHRIFVLYSERAILDLARHIFIKCHSYASTYMTINETSCLSILKMYHVQNCFLTQTHPEFPKNSNLCTMASVGEILFFQ